MITDEKELSDKIYYFYKERSEKSLQVVTIPYRGFEIFKNLIRQVHTRDRVLIITDEDEETGYLQKLLRDENINYSYLEDISNLDVSGLIICNFDLAKVISERDNTFDLIIFDDINSFPKHNLEQINEISQKLEKVCRKYILYSFEEVLKDRRVLYYPVNKLGGYITQPRFVLSNLNMRNDISNSVYDYIEYFYVNKFKVIIYVTDESVINGMVTAIKRINPRIVNNLYRLENNLTYEIRDLLNQEERAVIIFADKMRDYKEFGTDFQFIVAEAFHETYNYRQFVFLCARNNIEGKKNGEVLLVAPKVTEHMERAKKITMGFNKFLYDRMDKLNSGNTNLKE